MSAENEYNPIKKILVVEDDVVSRFLLQEILKEVNAEVFFARNGKEGVEMVVQDSSYDLILMDLKMPIMNGYEATEAIRALGYTKPIIAQTAFATKEDIEKIEARGFNLYLTKPVNKTALLLAIHNYLGT